MLGCLALGALGLGLLGFRGKGLGLWALGLKALSGVDHSCPKRLVLWGFQSLGFRVRV